MALAAAAALRPAPRTRSKTSLQASSNPAADELWVPTTAEDILWTPSSRDSSRDDAFGPLSDPLLDGRAKYCESLEAVLRRPTRTVTAGPVKFGSDHPIVRQTMGTTSTRDVRGTIEQVMRCADVGFDMVRITVVGMKEAQACHDIREGLFKKGYDIPLCADMHFQPKVAAGAGTAARWSMFLRTTSSASRRMTLAYWVSASARSFAKGPRAHLEAHVGTTTCARSRSP